MLCPWPEANSLTLCAVELSNVMLYRRYTNFLVIEVGSFATEFRLRPCQLPHLRPTCLRLHFPYANVPFLHLPTSLTVALVPLRLLHFRIEFRNAWPFLKYRSQATSQSLCPQYLSNA